MVMKQVIRELKKERRLHAKAVAQADRMLAKLGVSATRRRRKAKAKARPKPATAAPAKAAKAPAKKKKAAALTPEEIRARKAARKSGVAEEATGTDN